MSRVPVIMLRAKVPDASIAKRKATPVTADDYVALLTGDCDVYRPDGQLLCMLRRGAMSIDVTETARAQLRHLAMKYGSDNRASYAGYATATHQQGSGKGQTRATDKDGKAVVVPSAIAGYFEPQGGRFRFCRETAFVANELKRWNDVVPLVEEAAHLFKRYLPKKYRIQKDFADACSDDFRIVGTPFSTITVNHNVAGTVHQDAGDLKTGFGLISCHRQGDYTGGHLVFPQYRVAVDLEDRDLILFNPHDWHGVTKLVPATCGAHPAQEAAFVEAERITVVYYFREKLSKCGSAAEELAKAKAL